MRSYMSRGMRRVPTYYQDLIDIIGSNPGHVIGTTACLGGALPTQILRGTSYDKLGAWITQMIRIFGKENFYLEMQPSNNAEQIKVNKELINFAKIFGLGYIITTDSHYTKKEDRVIHEAYLKSKEGDREVASFYATTYMMGTQELESYFGYLTSEQLHYAYDNIEKIAAMCEDYSLLRPLNIPKLKWREHPEVEAKEREAWIRKIPYLEHFWNSDFIGDRILGDAVVEGIKKHPDLKNDEACAEINENLRSTWISSEVNKAHWSSYYLNMQTIIDICWDAGTIVGPARGSGGGFLLLYALDIIQINPMRETTKCYGWRFLNPERVSVLD